MNNLEVLFTPAEFVALKTRDLSSTTCVVFDVLRATSCMVTALAHGAKAMFPVSEIEEAVAVRRSRPHVLLGGERHGLRITASLTGGIEFDFGNSPREYTAAKVAGKTIVSTTTNGTRALRSCAGARAIFAAAFLNLDATAKHLAVRPPANLLLICSGTYDEAAYEDTFAAGALCDLLASQDPNFALADSAQIARQLFRAAPPDLTGLMQKSRNARRLLALPELRDDVAFCLRRNVFDLVAGVDATGHVVRVD